VLAARFLRSEGLLSVRLARIEAAALARGMKSDWASGYWAAATTAKGMEYSARLELERLGLHPYLPQHRRKWLPPGATRPVIRSYPLFPKYLFLPACEARSREAHYVRQLQGPKPLLCNGEGQLWLAPAADIFAIQQTENEGGFDEIRPVLGDRVKLKGNGALSAMDLVVACIDEKTAQLFSPLFGGARVKDFQSDAGGLNGLGRSVEGQRRLSAGRSRARSRQPDVRAEIGKRFEGAGKRSRRGEIVAAASVQLRLVQS
jgi:hypothetical protein